MEQPRISAFVAISLDGHIARADGRVDWLEPYQGGSIILGSGRPLFAPGIPAGTWKLVRTQAFPSGIVQVVYQRI